MINIYKNDIGNIVMAFDNEDQKQLKTTLADVLEELRIVASGDVITSVDSDICGKAIIGLKTIFGELIEEKEKKDEHIEVKRYVDMFNIPMVYNNKTDGYKVLSEIPERIWSDFLDELAKKGLTCNYNTTHDTFTIG